MNTSSHKIRGGSALAMLVLGWLSIPALAAADSGSSRFSVNATLQVQPSQLVGSGYAMQTTLSKEITTSVKQQDGRFSVSGRLGASTAACAGDLIFKNGFD